MDICLDIDVSIARVVRQSLLQRIWYLSEHLMNLAILDKSVIPNVKGVMDIHVQFLKPLTSEPVLEIS